MLHKKEAMQAVVFILLFFKLKVNGFFKTIYLILIINDLISKWKTCKLSSKNISLLTDIKFISPQEAIFFNPDKHFAVNRLTKTSVFNQEL